MKNLICASVGFFIASSVFAKEVEATADNVQILAAANRSAAVVGTLSKGESVSSKDRIGMYWQVTTKDGKDGFVSFTSVKAKKEQESASLSGALRDAVQEHRDENDPSNVRARSTVMGVRGLQESKEVGFAGNVRPNLRLVYNLESFPLNKQKVDAIGTSVQAEIARKMKNHP